jgi:hypothetical protein
LDGGSRQDGQGWGSPYGNCINLDMLPRYRVYWTQGSPRNSAVHGGQSGLWPPPSKLLTSWDTRARCWLLWDQASALGAGPKRRGAVLHLGHTAVALRKSWRHWGLGQGGGAARLGRGQGAASCSGESGTGSPRRVHTHGLKKDSKAAVPKGVRSGRPTISLYLYPLSRGVQSLLCPPGTTWL